MQAITKKPDPESLARLNDIMQQAGQAANEQASRIAFDDHTARKADNTIRRKVADLALFETFLRSAGVPAIGLYDNPGAWRGITWGLVEAFKVWMLQQGYAIGSINSRLSTVRTFSKIAAKAGSLTPQESILIASVQGYASKEARHIDEQRRAEGIQTRTGAKKAEAVTIPEDIAQALKAQPGTTGQGRRDTLIMCLLLDHGLRVEEVAILTAKAFDMKADTFTFYRPKVNKTQTHTLTADTRNVARAYLKHAPADGILWRKSSKGTGKLGGQVSETSATRAINKRVELLGRKAGIEGLSPHDCRHYAATFEARKVRR